MIQSLVFGATGAGNMPVNTLGAFIQGELTQRGWSIRHLGTRAGVEPSAISKLMRMPLKRPELNTLQALATALSLPLQRLIEAAGYLMSDVNSPAEAELRATLLTPATLAAIEQMGTDERAERLAFLNRAIHDQNFFNRVAGYIEGLEKR